eukprot:TRINITY_DN32638_c0_g1_i1.p1 TRINITY_DN32638_c0_g1~~TRINITY_DN32638_c0_g1_i1.p1  ORF type:complete len:280 (+),score=60.48 TRINITY_DN32638_c0_g1_i1:70-909(+)
MDAATPPLPSPTTPAEGGHRVMMDGWCCPPPVLGELSPNAARAGAQERECTGPPPELPKRPSRTFVRLRGSRSPIPGVAARPATCRCVALSPAEGFYAGLTREPFCPFTGQRHPGGLEVCETAEIRRAPGDMWGLQWGLPRNLAAELGGRDPVFCGAMPGSSAERLTLINHRVVAYNGERVRTLAELKDVASRVPPSQTELRITFLHTKLCCGGGQEFQQSRPPSALWGVSKMKRRGVCGVCMSVSSLFPYCPFTGYPHDDTAPRQSSPCNKRRRLDTS